MADDASFDASPDVLNATAQGRLRTIVERLERLEEEGVKVLIGIPNMKVHAKLCVIRKRVGDAIIKALESMDNVEGGVLKARRRDKFLDMGRHGLN